jgi:hypothetical protein
MKDSISCGSCGSKKLVRCKAEIAIHSSGLNRLYKPAVFLFPNVAVCLDCGMARFLVSGTELRLLAKE